MQRRRLTTKSKYHLPLITTLGFPLSHFWVRSPTDFKFSKRMLLYSHEQVAGLPPPLSLPPKGLKILDVPIHLSCRFSVGNTPQWYFAAGTGDFNVFGRPISTYDLQNSHPTLKYCSNVITVVGDRGTSQIHYGINNSLFQATIKNLWTYAYKNLVVSLRSHY